MTQQEFEQRTKTKIDPSDFMNKVTPVYFSADIEKDDFCKAYMQIRDGGDNLIVKALINEIESLKSELKLHDLFMDQVITQHGDDSAMRTACIDIVGTKGYVEKELKLGVDLNEDDREFLLNKLRS